MSNFLGRFGGLFYSLFRFFAGALFACHGAQKLFGVLGAKAQLGSPKMIVAGVIELGGGILIAVGLYASVSAILASGEMAVAYFTVHAPQSFWPILNGGELAVLYCFAFLFIAARGSGPLSADRAFRGKFKPSGRLTTRLPQPS
jgi:putative oxidoreductase